MGTRPSALLSSDEVLSELKGVHAIGEHHVTFGGGYRIHPQWQIDGGIEYVFKNEVTYTNPNLPFGPNAKESYEFASLHLTLSRRW